MKNKEEIRAYLDKYLEGLTSLEEESLLRKYFESGIYDREFISEAQWFLNTSREFNDYSRITSLENQMNQWVDQQENQERTLRKKYWISGIAACLILLIGTSVFFYNYRKHKLEDTYQDPQIAYLEAKKILMFVSQTMNKGTDRLQTVSRIESGSNELSIFSTFSSGLKNLELINKYQEKSIK